jgi:hypothetical protein
MLKKDYIKGNAYFDTYYVRNPETHQYVGIIEDHCRGVAARYFIGWKFKDNTYIPGTHRPAKTEMFDTYEDALQYIQEEF